MYKDNPSFIKQSEFNGVSVYTCVKETEYHTVRYIEALNWQAFASCGITKDKLSVLTDEIIDMCNAEKPAKTLKTDIASIAQLIKYAMKYPVDEHCGVQLGCMLSFIEYEVDGVTYSEPADKIDELFMRKKMDIALNNSDAYAFFLGWGIANIPEYRTHFDISTSTDYFKNRLQAMQAIMPENLKHLMK